MLEEKEFSAKAVSFHQSKRTELVNEQALVSSLAARSLRNHGRTSPVTRFLVNISAEPWCCDGFNCDASNKLGALTNTMGALTMVFTMLLEFNSYKERGAITKTEPTSGYETSTN